MTTTTNAKNFRQYKSELPLTVEQILGFTLKFILVSGVNTVYKFQTSCITLFYIMDNSHKKR